MWYADRIGVTPVSATTRLRLVGVLLLGLILSVCLFWRGDGPSAALERTRLALRRAGFKLDLAESDLRQSPEAAAREAALEKAGQAGYLFLAEALDFLPPVGTNSALVLANQPEVRLEPDTNTSASGFGGIPGLRPPTLLAEGCTNIWSALRRDLNQTALEQACAAALSSEGGIRVGEWACRLPDPLAARVLLALHEHDDPKVWTNLLALTRLMTRWLPQRSLMNLLYWRDVNLVRAYGATWQAVQARVLSEPQLAALQREWETADYRSGLPEIAGLARAEIEQRFRSPATWKLPPFPARLLGPPRQTWQQLSDRMQALHYRSVGRFRDQEALLRLFCACEEDFQRIQASSSWREVTAIRRFYQPAAGFTNLLVALTNQNWRSRKLREVSTKYAFAFEPKLPSRWFWRMADCETMRRLLVAALALERYRLRHGSYPESTAALAPDLLPNWPNDFMDGQPLRYRREEDGRFLLYSTGLDCRDDGGLNRAPGRPWYPPLDDLWPRPASPAEVAAEIAARQRTPPPHTPTFVPLK